MKTLHPYPGELDDPECAILFATLQRVKLAQLAHGERLSHYGTMDYLAIRAWSAGLSELREREKEARAAIFGYRRRTRERPKRAAAVWSDAPGGSSCESAPPDTGSGAPTPPTCGTSGSARPSLRVVGKS